MTDRRPTPRFARRAVLALAAACALGGPLSAQEPRDYPTRYSQRKPAWYDPFGLFTGDEKPKPTDHKVDALTAGDGPAWKWYGYGAPTPGRNPLAPNGSYSNVPTNWHDVVGTTPGAVPVNRVGGALPNIVPEVAPIPPSSIVAPPAIIRKEDIAGTSPYGPALSGPSIGSPAIDLQWKSSPASLKLPTITNSEPKATLRAPQPNDPAPSIPDVPPVNVIKPVPTTVPESPDLPVEAAPGIVAPPNTIRGTAPDRDAAELIASAVKRAIRPDSRIVAIDLVGKKSAVIRFAASADVVRAFRDRLAEAKELAGWRIEFELVSVVK